MPPPVMFLTRVNVYGAALFPQLAPLLQFLIIFLISMHIASLGPQNIRTVSSNFPYKVYTAYGKKCTTVFLPCTLASSDQKDLFQIGAEAVGYKPTITGRKMSQQRAL
jgi:hypothetical protein